MVTRSGPLIGPTALVPVIIAIAPVTARTGAGDVTIPAAVLIAAATIIGPGRTGLPARPVGAVAA